MSAPFDELVAGLDNDVKAPCERCESRHKEISEESNGEVQTPVRPAEFRMKVCGRTEWSLLCGLCWQAVSLGMIASIADGLSLGMAACGECQKLIPHPMFIMEHVDCEPIDQEGEE